VKSKRLAEVGPPRVVIVILWFQLGCRIGRLRRRKGESKAGKAHKMNIW
jgi:hypothetical protein